MKNLQLFLLILTVSMFSGTLKSQDVVFSQFDNTPLLLNPALAGSFDGKARVVFNFRNQSDVLSKGGSKRVRGIAIDSKCAINKSRSIGFGVLSNLNRNGEAKLGRNDIGLSSSLIQIIGDPKKAHHIFGVGFGLRFARNKVGGYYDFQGQLPPEPDVVTDYVDLSSGFVWTYISNSRFLYQMGLSVDHINRPEILLGNSFVEVIERRVNLQVNCKIPISTKITIDPQFLYAFQRSSSQLIVGSDIKYQYDVDNYYNPLSAISLGVYLRSLNDEYSNNPGSWLVFSAIGEVNQFRIGFSYDYPSSFSKGSSELMLGYVFGNNNK